jgi:hypothetical protein
MSNLDALINKYTAQLANMEAEVAEIRRKLDTVSMARDLLNKEGLSDNQTDLFVAAVKQVSDRYAELNYTQAISDVLKDKPDITGADMYDELLKHGFRSTSKTKRSDVFVKLYRLEKAGKIVSTKHKKGAKTYKLAQ